MLRVTENSLTQLYLKFCASLHNYYKKRDSTPSIFVWGTSTVLVGFNALFIYDFSQYYFFKGSSMSKGGMLGMVCVIAVLNYIFVIRKGDYKELYPSKSFNIGVVVYIALSLLLMIFIGLKYREVVH